MGIGMLRLTNIKPASLILVFLATAIPLDAKELLLGTVVLESEQELAFRVSGEDRQNIVGGEIQLGDETFQIAKVSRHGLIGAYRWGVTEEEQPRNYGEFVTFSSSFSEQTAEGRPWVAAQQYVNCESAYNSFLAVYRVYGRKALAALGDTPYPTLTDDAGAADESVVYCFMATRGRDKG